MSDGYWTENSEFKIGPYTFRREARYVLGEDKPRVVNWTRNRMTEEGMTPISFKSVGLDADAAALAERVYEMNRYHNP